MNKQETEEMQADVRNALTFALMDERIQYIPDFDKPITEYLQKQGYSKVEDYKKEIFALKTTLEDREHEVRELNKKVERLNKESTKFLYDAGYRKADKEKTEMYIAFLQEAYEKNPIHNTWCLEESNRLKECLEENNYE